MVFSLERLSNLYQQQNEFKAAIEAKIERFEIIRNLSKGEDLRIFTHNLASSKHMLALEYLKLKDVENYEKCLKESKEFFEKIVNMKSSKSNLTVEYVQFLIKHHDLSNLKEYKQIVDLLMPVIQLGDDKSELMYDQLEKVTVVEPLQKLLNNQQEIEIKPYLLAYYLLTNIHIIHAEYDKAKEIQTQFESTVSSLNTIEDKGFAEYLYQESNNLLINNLDNKNSETTS